MLTDALFASKITEFLGFPKKMEFYTNVLKMWNVMRDLQEEEQKSEEDRPLIAPSDVFRFKGNENAN